MIRQRLRFYATLAVCLLGFGAVGFLLGRGLRVHPVLAALTLGVVLVEGALERFQ